MHKARSILIWAVVALCVIVLVTLPVNLQAQLIASITVVAVMAIIKGLKGEGTWRLIALAFGTSIVMRYVYWRTTSTLPPINQPENFIPGLLLYLAEMYSVAMLALSLFIVATPLPPRPSRAGKLDRFPQVDVFVPTYNEDSASSRQYALRRQGMDYPADKLHVWLLDDGGTLQKRNSNKLARSPGGRRPAHRAQAVVRGTRRSLPDARTQRTCKGRQSQQRHAALDRRTDCRVRCRPRACARLPAGDSRLFRRRSEAVPGADAALLHQSRSAGAQSAHLRHHAERERDVLRHHPARPRQMERRLLLRIGSRAEPQGAGIATRVSAASASPRTAKRHFRCMAPAGTASMSTSR
jgi:hypothetical protein